MQDRSLAARIQAPAAVIDAVVPSGPVLFSAPHRVMFLAGTLQLLLTLLFWSVELLGRHTLLWPPLATSVPTTWVHAFLMLYGVFPFFIFGFLMTTYPKWLQTAPVPPRMYLASFWLLCGGTVTVYAGLILPRPVIEGGVIMFLCGWAVTACALWNVYLHPGKPCSAYETILSLALLSGFAGACSGLYWLIDGDPLAFRIMLVVGLWLFLLPVLITVSLRMIPFFASCVLDRYTMRRPAWSLPLIAGCLAGHALLEVMGMPQWLFLFDVPLAGAVLYLSWIWEIRRGFRVPLLAMLHVAFLWCGIGALLYSIQSLVWLLGGGIVLGKAPLHALGLGFVTSMVLAMASRVSLGHSGRPLTATRVTLVCFAFLQFAVLLRIASEWPFIGAAASAYWNTAAAFLGVFIMALWTWLYLPIYLTPRVDGKPG
ncbi:MAG: NnrS family protein [Gammaproteobacteria bacterium]|nr:NnrS family protein [Gammaproteobacteria bacterium]